MTAPLTLAQLNALPRAQFCKLLGGVFEHSPWVAEHVAPLRPFANLEALHAAMVQCVADAGPRAQLELIRAHPELAGKAAIRGDLTPESSSEQHAAGLDQCSPQELQDLTRLNEAYHQKFGFPFILAVRGHNRQSVIYELTRRIALSESEEKAQCLDQIYQIARLRLEALLHSHQE